MAKTRVINSYLVKRTATGQVRFSLRNREQASLKTMLEDVANARPVADLQDFALLVSETGRRRAQEWLTRRNVLLMPLSKEHRFTMSLADCYSLLEMLWTEPGLEFKPELSRIWTDLHYLLTTSLTA
jgi:hypothetical protein